MDECAQTNGVVASLARLRTNALLAMTTGGEQIIGPADIERLDAIAAEAFGTPLAGVEFAPVGSGPKPDGPIFKALSQRLSEEEAKGAHRFLIDLHQRIHGWFND